MSYRSTQFNSPESRLHWVRLVELESGDYRKHVHDPRRLRRVSEVSGSDASSDEPDQAFVDTWIRKYDSVNTIVFGRRAYEDHVNYHSLAARKASDPKFLFDYSRFLERSQKVSSLTS
jgi:hypothetical protein